ncbi:MAG: AP2 domain-containing protein [Verrucomicrobiales bacterium]|nr:AP2 domain-containing protein [Verrucomicrobiales bacterium]
MSDDSANLRGISRLEQESSGTYGWQVRIQRNGVRYGRFFSDYEWGGTQKALNIALQYRDRVIAHQERVSQTSVRAHETVGARNQSGVVGVTRISQRSAKGIEYHFWQASWTDQDGNRRTVRYSVLKLGEEKAFELACVAREDALKG